MSETGHNSLDGELQTEAVQAAATVHDSTVQQSETAAAFASGQIDNPLEGDSVSHASIDEGVDQRESLDRKLWVGHLPDGYPKDELMAIFSQCGPIQQLRDGNGGFAFITFEERSSVQKAIDQFHQKFYRGNRLQVQQARAPGRGGRSRGGRGRQRRRRPPQDGYRQGPQMYPSYEMSPQGRPSGWGQMGPQGPPQIAMRSYHEGDMYNPNFGTGMDSYPPSYALPDQGYPQPMRHGQDQPSHGHGQPPHSQRRPPLHYVPGRRY